MKIERPMTLSEQRQRIKPVPPDPEVLRKNTTVALSLGLPLKEDSKVKIKQVSKDASVSQLEVTVPLSNIGKHVSAPTLKAIAIADNIDDEQHESRPLIPKHLPYEPLPDNLLKGIPSSHRPHFRKSSKALFRNRFLAIIGPDDRVLLSATSYPWGTVGRVVSSGGWSGTGVMIGPRHMLTVSHLIDWQSGGSGWVSFTPAQFDSATPFGTAMGTTVYYQTKVEDNAGSFNQRRDYAVVVLNWRIGDLTGWLGTRPYQNDWDDEPYWWHIGYPGDMGSMRPTWQNSVELDARGVRHRAMRMRHTADAVLGQSGGPFFGFWDDGPYIVAVDTAEYCGLLGCRNFASGGRLMTRLARKALDEHP